MNKSVSIILFIASSLTGFILVQTAQAENSMAKKILFVDSYHQGYTASSHIVSGVKEALTGHNIDFKLIEMDSKRNPEPADIKVSALKVKTIIDAYQPDVLIACDDNAAKYLIEPFYKNSDLPIVFCGINWNASIYGFPFRNMTGIVEVALVSEIIRHLKKHSKGNRIGFLGGDRLSERKNRQYYQKRFNIDFAKTYFASSFEQWQHAFAKLQDEVDMLIITTHAGITDWNDADAQTFVEKHVKIPVATENEWEMSHALVGITKDYKEMGLWSGHTALKILAGIPPNQIPITSNKKGKLFFNTRIAKILGITKVPELAEIVD